MTLTMSTQTSIQTKCSNNNQLLSEVIQTSQHHLPVDVSLSTGTLFIQNVAELDYSPAFELVVFDTLSVAHLAEVFIILSLEHAHLVAVNTRVNKTSYRFAVNLNSEQDFSQLKSSINEYALEQQFEMAFLQNVPSLSTPGLLVMDMDSTTIEIECIDEIAKLAGVGEQVSEVTELAMQGKLDFAESLRARVATLKNAPDSILSQVGDNLPLMPGLEVLVKQLHAHNWKVAVASGGFTYFTEILKQQLQLDATQANVLEITNGKLTGNVLGDITDAQVKADTLIKLADEYQFDIEQTVAMGDGANDLTMMAAANLGVAYKAKPVVLQQAQSSINFSGLDCLLHWLK